MKFVYCLIVLINGAFATLLPAACKRLAAGKEGVDIRSLAAHDERAFVPLVIEVGIVAILPKFLGHSGNGVLNGGICYLAAAQSAFTAFFQRFLAVLV